MNLPAFLFMPALSLLSEDCNLPQDPGDCKEFRTRFFHNSATGSCEEFAWGGCGGNKNNFKTVYECQHACSEVNQDAMKECTLPVLPGGCGSDLTRFYYNDMTGTCEKFVYGGCGGNANNFADLETCERKCVRPKKRRCDLKPDPGRCMANMERFYFDPRTNDCQSFIYGGCGGNMNNYHDIETCLRVCRKKKSHNVEEDARV